ncbi:AbiH family protein [Lactococcus fujiensis]|uniref:AbiH family protein n=1 Tax=Lactococcus fujiensis TaxID=610251 RepID=UPI000B31B015|nr:AbiH family protein [Lactococcus fujiensis]
MIHLIYFFEEIDTINKLFSEDDIMSSILSFNYTEPLKQLNLRNIHGALSEGNILFGIDYDKLKDNFTEPPIEFSKSYRILESGRDTKMNISSDIDIIKFYGHGLGEADYSYFQAIFDSVDLYHSNTKIIFYWSQYEGVDKKTIRVEQVKNVTNLIEEYGTTFTNQDHGRNLLTKLQLENRLQINEIPINNLFECLI